MSKLSELTDLVRHTQAEQARELASVRFRVLLLSGPAASLVLSVLPGFEGMAVTVLVSGLGLAFAWAGMSFFIISDTYATPEIMRLVSELNISHKNAYGRLRRQFAKKGRVPLSAVMDYLQAEARMRASLRAVSEPGTQEQLVSQS